MRHAVLAAEHAGRAVGRPLARGIAERGLLRLHDEIKRDAEPAAMLSVAAGIGEIFVLAEMQGKARLGHFDAAELQAARGMPLADRRPAVALRGRAAARPRMKQMPDEGLSGARVLAL